MRARPAEGLPAGAASLTPVPHSEVAAKPTRRRFTAEYKLRVLREAESRNEPGAIGAVLRREGLRRVLVLYDPRDASPREGVADAREAAPKLGLTLVERETRSREDIARGLEALGEVHALLAIPGG